MAHMMKDFPNSSQAAEHAEHGNHVEGKGEEEVIAATESQCTDLEKNDEVLQLSKWRGEEKSYSEMVQLVNRKCEGLGDMVNLLAEVYERWTKNRQQQLCRKQ